MKATTLLLALILTACTSSCGQQPRVSWPSVVSCTEPAQPDLLAAVQAVLVQPEPEGGESSSIGQRAAQQIEELARAHGAHVLACLVDEAVQSFDRAGAAAPPKSARSMAPRSAEAGPSVVAGLTDEQLAAARGRDFLQRVAKTRVEADAQ